MMLGTIDVTFVPAEDAATAENRLPDGVPPTAYAKPVTLKSRETGSRGGFLVADPGPDAHPCLKLISREGLRSLDAVVGDA